MSQNYIPTVFDNYGTEIEVKNQKYMLELWDTAGQEAYERLRPLSYQYADVAVICYDVMKPNNIEHVTRIWVPEVRHHCPGVPIILVACKTDLRRIVENKSKYHTAASSLSLSHMESSLKSDQEQFITTSKVHVAKTHRYKFMMYVLTTRAI